MNSISLPRNFRSHPTESSSPAPVMPSETPAPPGAPRFASDDGVDSPLPGPQLLSDGEPPIILAAGEAQIAIGLAALSWAVGKILDGANERLVKVAKSLPKPDIAPPPVDGGIG